MKQTSEQYKELIYEKIKGFFGDNEDAMECWFYSVNYALKDSPRRLVLVGQGQRVLDFVNKSLIQKSA